MKEVAGERGSITSLALRCGSLLLDGSIPEEGGSALLLDGSLAFRSAYPYQQTTAEQLCRFINSELYYTERQLNLMLRGLQVLNLITNPDNRDNSTNPDNSDNPNNPDNSDNPDDQNSANSPINLD